MLLKAKQGLRIMQQNIGIQYEEFFQAAYPFLYLFPVKFAISCSFSFLSEYYFFFAIFTLLEKQLII